MKGFQRVFRSGFLGMMKDVVYGVGERYLSEEKRYSEGYTHLKPAIFTPHHIRTF